MLYEVITLGAILVVMALETELVPLLHEHPRIGALVRVVAAGTAIIESGVDMLLAAGDIVVAHGAEGGPAPLGRNNFV